MLVDRTGHGALDVRSQTTVKTTRTFAAAYKLLWTKTPAASQLDVGRTVLFGHVPDRRPWDLGHCIALDTGAGKSWADAALTAVLLPERRFIRVS